MSALLRFFIIAAFVLGMAICAFGRQVRVNTEVPWIYHPNRPGVEAYMRGGAFAANTGSVTAMLFNPAGLAQMPGRLTATVETGWASNTEYIRFFNIDLASGFQPVQFAGVALQPCRKLSVGIFYARPTDYNLDFGRIELVDETTPDGTGQVYEPEMAREQTSLGLTLATSLGEPLYLGGGVEWRRSSIQDEIISIRSEGDADAVRFSLGAILKIRQWHLGVAAQTKYKASGDITYKDKAPLEIRIDPDPSRGGPFELTPLITSRFSNEDPATIRFGVATPYTFGRLRLSADAEYKDFESTVPIERWQFYGGGSVKLTPNFNLGFGAFTFRKDYSAYIEGPDSEFFWTVGGSVELSQFRFSGSFMDGDLFTQNFAGQRFINFAVSFIVP
jgi:hypothetical protein